MLAQLRAAVAAFVLLTAITGIAYPLLITVIGQVAFPYHANGSLIVRDGQVVGSALIGQAADDDGYFWSRPSAVDYMQGSAPDALIASAATNYGWTNATLAEQVAERATRIRTASGVSDDTAIPSDLLFASGSGLDPHISPEAAAIQIERVAQARGLGTPQVEALVAQHTESPQLGVFGERRVNVLLLNLALDAVD